MTKVSRMVKHQVCDKPCQECLQQIQVYSKVTDKVTNGLVQAAMVCMCSISTYNTSCITHMCKQV